MFVGMRKAVTVGASLGSLLLVLELMAVTFGDGLWGTLESAPLLAWGGGAIAGGLGGVLWARRGSGSLLMVTLAGITLAQVNHRWLPDALEPVSLAASVAIVVFFALMARKFGARLGALVDRGGYAMVPGGVLLAAALVRMDSSPPVTLSLWEPENGVALPAGPGPGEKRLLLLGIDGGRWDTIDPLIESGRMPNLAALVARGTRGVLRSSVDSASPVVWTTIMTGWNPSDHGITDWEVAVSTNRRVRAVWNLLSDFGWNTYVENVPGSYPAEFVLGGMLAGFPMPQGSRSNRGWLATQGPATDPRGPLHTPLPERGRLELRDLSGAFALEKTTPFLILRWINERRALDLVRPLVASPFVSLDVEVTRGDGSWRIRASAAGERFFDLGPGEWGPWLQVAREGEKSLVRFMGLPGDEPGLFASALYPEGAPGLSSPPEFAERVASAGRPFVAEGTGWQIFFESKALAPLEEHHAHLSEDRARAACRILDETPWDALVHVFTLTDRIQHPFWKYREPDLYGALPEEMPERATSRYYETHLPLAEEVSAFGGAIDRAYETVDRWLGEVVARADSSTLIVVVSDHGGQGGPHRISPTAGIHHEDGIYLAVGPALEASAELGPALEQVDVLPLVLAHLGLPGAQDLPGRVPAALAPRGADGIPVLLPDPVSTYEVGDRNTRSGEISSAVRDQLRSLGYLK